VCKLLPIPSSSSCFFFNIFNIISESGRIALEAVPWIFWFSFLRVLKSLDFSLVGNCLVQMLVLVLFLSVEFGACVQVVANTFHLTNEHISIQNSVCRKAKQMLTGLEFLTKNNSISISHLQK